MGVPEHRHLAELHHLVHRRVEVVGSVEHRGQLCAVEWVTGCRATAPVTRDAERVEAWVAAEAPAPPASDWASFIHVYPLPAVERDPGARLRVWRTPAWIVVCAGT